MLEVQKPSFWILFLGMSKNWVAAFKTRLSTKNLPFCTKAKPQVHIIYIYILYVDVFAHPSLGRTLRSIARKKMQPLTPTTHPHLFGWWCRAHRHDLQLFLAANGCAVEERQHGGQDHDPNLGIGELRLASASTLHKLHGTTITGQTHQTWRQLR